MMKHCGSSGKNAIRLNIASLNGNCCISVAKISRGTLFALVIPDFIMNILMEENTNGFRKL